MKKIAIITARGGSKRIPRKNIKLFLGKPIIAYSIKAALESNLFDEVMVSTDDLEIAAIAKDCGATVPFMRSSDNSDDYAPTVNVLLEVIKSYEEMGVNFTHGCCIYPTAPFITDVLLKKAYNRLIENNLDVVMPVISFKAPIQRALKVDDASKIEMFQPEHLTTRSQDLTPAYYDSGQFYWFDTTILKVKKSLWTDNTGTIILSDMEAQDIDTLEDWNLAEFKHQFQSRGGVST